MGTIFLLLLWAKITADLAVRGLFVGGDLRFLDKKTRACALHFLYPLEQASYLVYKACFPTSFCRGILDKMAVLQNGASVFVNDGGFMASLLSTSWCIANAYPVVGGVPAVVVTCLGMSASDNTQFIM